MIELGKRGGDRVLVTVDGKPFTEYRPGGEADGGGHLPYLYPVYGPGGQALTRNWPMSEAEGEERDHPHHRSLWFAHGAVGLADGGKRYDIWNGRDGSAIVHRKILTVESGEAGVLGTANSWVDPGGDEMLREERTMTFRAGTFDTGQAWRAIDFDVRLSAGDRAVVLGDTKEGTMAIRVAATLRHQGERAAGSMRNSEGVEGVDVWGKRAAWVHYTGPVEGKAGRHRDLRPPGELPPPDLVARPRLRPVRGESLRSPPLREGGEGHGRLDDSGRRRAEAAVPAAVP